MPQSMEVSVNPKVLIWARKSNGKKIEDVAKRVSVKEDIVKRWESGEKKPTLIQIKKLSKYYKRSLAVFFLPEPPEEPSIPKDFRSLPGEDQLEISTKTRLAMRRARRLQSIAKELNEKLVRNIDEYKGKFKISDDPEELSKKIREILKIPIEMQYDWNSENDALNTWKKSIEELGILVFQTSIPIEDARAFSITDDGVPVIVLNTKDIIKARIFSLLHELGHILLEKGGICDLSKGGLWEINKQKIPSSEVKNIEIFCNHLAGATLVPKNELLNQNIVINKGIGDEWSPQDLGRLAKRFWVSREVILRRLVIFNRASKNYYKQKHDEWEKKNLKRLGKGGGGARNIPKECIQKNGKPFVSLVLESYRKERITSSDVSDYLNIRMKYLTKVEQLIGAKV